MKKEIYERIIIEINPKNIPPLFFFQLKIINTKLNDKG